MYSGTIPELSDAWYELSGRDKEKHYFRDHVELASREVSKWPEWKQNVLGRVVDVQDKEQPK